MADQDRYAQDTEFLLLEILAASITAKTYVDVGAEKGSFASFFMRQGFHGYLFEPCPKHHAELRDLTENTDSSFYPYAIDDRDRTADFFLSYDEGGDLHDYFHSLHRLTDDPRVHHQDAISVACRSLASLVAEGLLLPEVGILKTDTEGNDLNVLKGMGPFRAEALICEFFTEGLYAGWEQAHPSGLIAEAEKLGYRHYLAIKKKNGRELLSWSPAAFTTQQWGNLIFLSEPVYHRCFEALHEVVGSLEDQLLGDADRPSTASLQHEVQSLRAICAKRLELITFLHEEAEKRLNVIQQLEKELQKKNAE